MKELVFETILISRNKQFELWSMVMIMLDPSDFHSQESWGLRRLVAGGRDPASYGSGLL